MDARKVGETAQAALNGVADVKAAADKAIADPTKAKERASLMAKPFRFSLSSLATVNCVVRAFAEHRCLKRVA